MTLARNKIKFQQKMKNITTEVWILIKMVNSMKENNKFMLCELVVSKIHNNKIVYN